ncbi:MAG: NAD-dependent epimerase/dehydratase family protein, partial [Alphaproteobacteria bacterium]|nr:NAD-dependent epimerase/dehydratase family protein [Alphaproteobacteria bacterium]
MRILVTGVAGFIGMHVALRLLADGHEVIGLDNINDYYDVRLKQARLAHIGNPNQFYFKKLDLCDLAGINSLFAERQPEIVINLAAQAGVRYSLENPHSYIESNLVGFTNILEACRHFDIEHLVYASSSSVYGLNAEIPFHEGQNVDHPLALYGATKKANELLAHSYSHLFGLPTTGLRFFTVYGPWGRPDMALFKFTDAIMSGQPIDIYNHGQMTRDFTFIDDIVEGVVRLAIKPAQVNTAFDRENPD